ncbi:hypothetical protein H0H92_011568 [Tricholoma furcatifolium]|nr:hypothetical protein H0H92_011568 [Tricholoma furcatifolium]
MTEPITEAGGDRISERFNSEDADVAFRSSDGVIFKLHSANLNTATENLVVRRGTKLIEPVALDDKSDALTTLFQFVYPALHPDLEGLDFPRLLSIATAAEKYRIYSAMNVCKIQIKHTLPQHSREIVYYGMSFRYHDIVDIAAPLVISIPLKDLSSGIPLAYLVPWQRALAYPLLPKPTTSSTSAPSATTSSSSLSNAPPAAPAAQAASAAPFGQAKQPATNTTSTTPFGFGTFGRSGSSSNATAPLFTSASAFAKPAPVPAAQSFGAPTTGSSFAAFGAAPTTGSSFAAFGQKSTGSSSTTALSTPSAFPTSPQPTAGSAVPKPKPAFGFISQPTSPVEASHPCEEGLKKIVEIMGKLGQNLGTLRSLDMTFGYSSIFGYSVVCPTCREMIDDWRKAVITDVSRIPKFSTFLTTQN